MVTVATVYRTGGIYSREWVWALKRGLNRHMPPGWDFRVLTDDPAVEHYWRTPLIHGWPGWWSKLELFRPGLFRGRVLYLDLDTLPVGDLSEIAAYDGQFAMLSDFYHPERAESGVMAWDGDEMVGIYERFLREGMAGETRDGKWIANRFLSTRLQDVLPGQIASWKVHARDGKPEGARLVCAHGRPKFDSPESGWAHAQWQSLATKSEEVMAC